MKTIYPIRICKSKKVLNKNAVYLRKLYFKYRRKYLKKYCGPLPSRLKLIRAWFWDEIIINSRRLVRKNGPKVTKFAGRSILKQYIDLVWLSLTIPTIPKNYYIFEFYISENRKVAGDYIFRHELKNVLYKMLVDINNINEISPLIDKGAFYRKAKESALPVIPTICTITDNQVKYYEQGLAGDLFIKSLVGKGGRGAQVWSYNCQEDMYNGLKGESYSLSQLLERYKETSYAEPVIVQTKMGNHSDIIDLSCDALSTCRIITVLNEKDQPEVVTAVFRMAALEGIVVDNLHRGGIAAPIDIVTGVLGRATDMGTKIGLGRVSHHPANGAMIEGRKLPYWDTIIQLVIRAHECFRPRVIIGWDICITQAGPVLVEGNDQPGVVLLQRHTNKPIGSSRLGELLAFHLRRKFN